MKTMMTDSVKMAAEMAARVLDGVTENHRAMSHLAAACETRNTRTAYLMLVDMARRGDVAQLTRDGRVAVARTIKALRTTDGGLAAWYAGDATRLAAEVLG